MASKLSVYNGALVKYLGLRRLSSLSENRKSRRVLDTIWDGGVVTSVLENGQWNFGIRTFESAYDPDVSTEFGYEYAHQKPSDWVRTVAVSPNEDFTSGFRAYTDEGGYWYANLDTLYIQIISNDEDYGGDLTLWPESAIDCLELTLALKAAKSLTDSDVIVAELEEKLLRHRRAAKSIDAMNQPTKVLPSGSWLKSRLGIR